MFLKGKYFKVLAAVCWIFIFLSVSPVFAADEHFVVIVNNANNVGGISANEIKLIYLGKKKMWSNGEKIVMWLPASQSAEMRFLLSEILKFKDEMDLKKYYLSAIFEQRMTVIPSAVRNPEDTARKVAKNKGGIALVNEADVQGYEGIKILNIKE